MSQLYFEQIPKLGFVFEVKNFSGVIVREISSKEQSTIYDDAMGETAIRSVIIRVLQGHSEQLSPFKDCTQTYTNT